MLWKRPRPKCVIDGKDREDENDLALGPACGSVAWDMGTCGFANFPGPGVRNKKPTLLRFRCLRRNHSSATNNNMQPNIEPISAPTMVPTLRWTSAHLIGVVRLREHLL